MPLLSITDFFAHLHPALVHLPIAMLLIAVVLQLMSQKARYAAFRPAIPIILLAGLLSAVVSCITGFLLFRNGGYDRGLVSLHMWVALTLTFVSFALFARSAFGGPVAAFDRTGSLLAIAVVVLIILTGHLGGSLTHGTDYLVSPFRGAPAFAGARGVVGAQGIVPDQPAEPADPKAIAALQHTGVVVMPMARNSNYLSVDLSSVKAASLMPLLLSLKKQLVQLDLSNSGIGDSAMVVVGQCEQVRSLVLSHTAITDKGLAALAGLKELRVLNLVETSVTGEGLLGMRPPEHLHVVYLYHTRVEAKYWEKLRGLFKGAVLDSGGYALPVLTTDTAVVRVARP